MLYNYEFINSSSTREEKKYLDNIIYLHMHRLMFDFKYKKVSEITAFDLIANTLSKFLLSKNSDKDIDYLNHIIDNQIDVLGVHKSYNVLEHAKFLNCIYELKNIFLFFNEKIPKFLDNNIMKMNSILNEYFHTDGSIPLFNGANNNYTKIIYESLNKDEYLNQDLFKYKKWFSIFFK